MSVEAKTEMGTKCRLPSFCSRYFRVPSLFLSTHLNVYLNEFY